MEWSRADLKQRAKDFLRTRYWYALLATFLVALLGGLGNGGTSFTTSFQQYGNGTFEFPPALVALVAVIGFIASLFGIAFALFVTGPATIGMNRWFRRTAAGGEPGNIGLLFSVFRKGVYLKAVGAYAWYSLWMFLWMLPCVAPLTASVVLMLIAARISNDTALVFAGVSILLVAVGIALMTPAFMKGYAYRMTPWILSENPGIGYKRALKLSMAMTDGHKAGMFGLDLSFIGWSLAGLLACCVGLYFLQPYVVATWAELYGTLRAQALEKGLCTPEELAEAPEGLPA